MGSDPRVAREAAYQAAMVVYAEAVAGPLSSSPARAVCEACDAFLAKLLEDNRDAIEEALYEALDETVCMGDTREHTPAPRPLLSLVDAVVRVLAAGTYQETEKDG